jgi:hypothetical protein
LHVESADILDIQQRSKCSWPRERRLPAYFLANVQVIAKSTCIRHSHVRFRTSLKASLLNQGFIGALKASQEPFILRAVQMMDIPCSIHASSSRWISRKVQFRASASGWQEAPGVISVGARKKSWREDRELPRRFNI